MNQFSTEALNLPPASSMTFFPPRGNVEHLFEVSAITQQGPNLHATMLTGPWLKSGSTGDVSCLAIFADFLFSSAAMQHRPPGTWAVTTELCLNFLGPVPIDGSLLHGYATNLLSDEEGGFAQGEIHDAQGRRVAQGSAWVKTSQDLPSSVRHGAYSPSAEINTGISKFNSINEVLPMLKTGSPTQIQVLADPRIVNPHGSTHGGILASLAVRASLVSVTDDEKPLLIPSSINVRYARPVIGDITLRVDDQHHGRSLRVTEVTVIGGTGKAGTHAVVTYRKPS